MSGSILVDTNIIIAYFNQDDDIVAKIGQVDELFIPIIVAGELYFGAEKSRKSAENKSRIELFLESNVILGCDKNAAQSYGQIKNLLKRKGRPIPENDIWIAAIAMQHQLTLVSRDAHFAEIDGLKLEHW